MKIKTVNNAKEFYAIKDFKKYVEISLQENIADECSKYYCSSTATVNRWKADSEKIPAWAEKIIMQSIYTSMLDKKIGNLLEEKKEIKKGIKNFYKSLKEMNKLSK